MAIANANYESMEKEAKGYLEIGVDEFYFDKMRPYLQEVLMKCRTDKELMRTIEKVINAADSFCVDKNYQDFMESFNVLDKAITDKNYFNGVIKKASEEEREMIRTLISKIADLRLIVKCEPPYQKKEQQTKERLNYSSSDSSPIGENKDYLTRNMKTLNKPSPKERIPNV